MHVSNKAFWLGSPPQQLHLTLIRPPFLAFTPIFDFLDLPHAKYNPFCGHESSTRSLPARKLLDSTQNPPVAGPPDALASYILLASFRPLGSNSLYLPPSPAVSLSSLLANLSLRSDSACR